MTQPLIIDGHLDLAMNAVLWNRDLTQPLEAIREREAEKADKPDRGRGVVSFDEMKRGNIGICIATQIGHSVSQNSPLEGWHSAEIAWAQTQSQLAWYRVMEENGVMAAITDRQSMDRQLQRWNDDSDNCPLGYILSLEGGDSMLTLQYLDRAYEYGLRAVGPAHYGPGRYSPGTGEEGPLEPAGRELVKRMAELGMALDVTHLTDKAFWEALEIFDGVCWASHSNCRSLVPAQRQLSDDQIKALVQRDAVIGAAFDAWMLIPDWVRGETTPEDTGVSMQNVADHIDYICQLVGTSRHCCIGSDLDGGYGMEQCPGDLKSIADLQQLAEILLSRGYSQSDLDGIMQGNWIRRFNDLWSNE